MYAELWIDFYKDMNVVGHDLHFNNLSLKLRGYILEDRFEAHVYSIREDLTPILRAPYDMVFAGIHDVGIGLVVRHAPSIYHLAIYAT